MVEHLWLSGYCSNCENNNEGLSTFLFLSNDARKKEKERKNIKNDCCIQLQMNAHQACLKLQLGGDIKKGGIKKKGRWKKVMT